MSKESKKKSDYHFDQFEPLDKGFKKIWAPWRLDYILDPDRIKKNTDKKTCVFCKREKPKNPKDAKKSDRQDLILRRAKKCYTIMNKFPYTNGHLMIVPFEHVGEFTKFSKELAQEFILEVQFSCQILEKVLHAQGFNVGMNLGRAAGAGIPNHAHMHIVPRWQGDTNFMPIIAHTRVLPEYNEKTYDRLIGAFQK